MREPLVWTVHPNARSVSDVRRELRRECDGLPARLREDTVLLSSELVTNAIRHGRGDVTVRLWPGPDRVRLEVSDDSPVPPMVRESDVASEAGRGMAIVDALSTQWGATPPAVRGGKTVWVELDDRRP
jgi:signal transduction histidine kinase